MKTIIVKGDYRTDKYSMYCYLVNAGFKPTRIEPAPSNPNRNRWFFNRECIPIINHYFQSHNSNVRVIAE